MDDGDPLFGLLRWLETHEGRVLIGVLIGLLLSIFGVVLIIAVVISLVRSVT